MTTEENGTTETAESSQPEVHVSPAEEENPDESETLGTIYQSYLKTKCDN